MRARLRLRLFVGLAVLVGTLAFSVSAASAQNAVHGIGFIKGCDSPTNVGDPMNCSYGILNLPIIDTAHDTLRIFALSDQVHSATGDVNSGNILGQLQLIFGGTATPICVGGSGSGTVADPYIGATACQLPSGAVISTNSHSFYTVKAADFGLPGHKLTDTATLLWSDLCDGTSDNCATGGQTITAGSSTDVVQPASTTATSIHDAAHQTVTTVPAGSTVHDFVTVTGQPGLPNPSGNVVVDWFTNGTCAGDGPAASSGNLALNGSGQVDATSFPQGPLAPGFYGFKARYLGDNTYQPSVGACEPLQVVDANIQITPPTATNQVGTNHVLTCHINVNDGSGFTNAPAGTVCTVNIIAGPGTPTTQQCATVGTTGSCDVTITSTTAGTSTIQATTTLAIGSPTPVMLTRTTGDNLAGDSPNATKLWVNAAITITPSATNAVGQPHTFTVTVLQDSGSGLTPVGADLPCNVTLTNGNGAVANPAGPFNLTTNASGQCAVTFTSATAGTVTGTASSTVTINGVVMNVSTNGSAPNSGAAVKTFVDANIQITPASANNAVGTNHTLTGHVNVNAGSGFGNAPAGTTIGFSILSGPGSFVGGVTNCTTVGTTGSCTVQITSPTPGTTVVRAKTDVVVSGLTLHRETGDGKAGDSADASKNWGDDTVRTDILNASNAVVTTVQAGTVVHDRVQVQRTGGTPSTMPNPTGTVVFHRYTTGDCTGTATDQSVALTQGDPSTAVSADFAPTANMSYKADYQGDANYPARTGACEPLTVTPVPQPAIAIVKNPKGQTVAKGGTARFTITVTNTGNVTLTNVTVTDPLSPGCDRTSAQIPALASMAPNASVTYSCSQTNVQKAYDNVATATGTPPTGPNVTASDTAPVKVERLVQPKQHPKVVSHARPKATG